MTKIIGLFGITYLNILGILHQYKTKLPWALIRVNSRQFRVYLQKLHAYWQKLLFREYFVFIGESVVISRGK